MLKDKVLIIYVTRNNHVFLQNFIASLEKHRAGYDYDLLIADNSSDDKAHLLTLQHQAKKYIVETYENDRVEGSFASAAGKYVGQYKYYLFLHDDTAINKDGWLKRYVDRFGSGYVEKQIQHLDISLLPIGRVGAAHQFYRNYTHMMGIQLQSVFLLHVLELLYPGKVPSLYKFVDPERVMYSNDCLVANGITCLNDFRLHPKYNEICDILRRDLPYTDEGIPPRDKYPVGYCWNKMTMLVEFMNSVVPLINGYRSVGLGGDGYVEQIDGYDTPFSHDFIHHYGSPNMKKFVGKNFGVDAEEISKKISSKDRAFLLKCDKLVRDYYK